MKINTNSTGASQKHVKHGLTLAGIALISCLATVAFPQALTENSAKEQSKPNCPADSAKDVVQKLWGMAASGEMMARWGSAARLFSEPGPWPHDRSVRVFSDYWWVEYYECSNKSEATVIVQSHWDRIPGVIDASLHFTPPPPSAVQAGTGYRVVMSAPQMYYWGSDGRPVPAKPTDEPPRWLIQGPPSPPFLTVTAAVRYVLEERAKTTDPVIKNNADETVARLLKMH